MTSILYKLKKEAPLVHCITNYVAMNISANTLLAIGASPAMIHTPEETAEFAKIAGALTINIGTISPHWLRGMKNAIESAKSNNIPWVFDPVAHFATPFRNELALELLSLQPNILRGNASEIIGLSGNQSAAKGVDSKDEVDSAENAAKKIAVDHNSIVIVTGVTDLITDGKQVIRVEGGSNIMPKVTALGCSLTCLLGAFVAIEDPLKASLSATTIFSLAGKRAHKISKGPGTFAQNFIDQISLIEDTEFEKSLIVNENI